MDASFRQKWKDWRDDTEQRIAKGRKEWQSKWQELADKKSLWLDEINTGMSKSAMEKSLRDITALVDGMVEDVQSRYGDVIGEVDVEQILAEIMKDEPDLIPQELMDEIKNTKIDFAITNLTNRSNDKQIFNDYGELSNDFDKSVKETQNLRLIQAMTKMLEGFEHQIIAMDKNSEDSADNYAESNDYVKQGKRYIREVGFMDEVQKVVIYENFKFHRKNILTDKDISGAMANLKILESFEFDAYMSALMKKMEYNFEKVLDKDEAGSITKHVGDFPEYNNDGDVTDNGNGEFGRIGMEIKKDNDRIANLQAASTIANIVVDTVAGVVVTAVSFGAASVAVAAIIAYKNSMKQVALHQMEMDELVFNVGKAVALSAAGSALNGLGKAGQIASAGMNFASQGVKYDHDKGFELGYTQRDLIVGGIGFAAASINVGIGKSNGFGANLGKAGVNFTSSMISSSFNFDEDGNLGKDRWSFGWDNVARGAAGAGSGLVNSLMGNLGSEYNIARKGLSGMVENGIMMAYEGGRSGNWGEAFRGQNWSSGAYTLEDWGSDTVKDSFNSYRAREKAEAKAKENGIPIKDRSKLPGQDAEGLLGLAWLGLKKVGSVLGDAWGGVSDWIGNQVESMDNWLGGKGYATKNELEKNYLNLQLPYMLASNVNGNGAQNIAIGTGFIPSKEKQQEINKAKEKLNGKSFSEKAGDFFNSVGSFFKDTVWGGIKSVVSTVWSFVRQTALVESISEIFSAGKKDYEYEQEHGFEKTKNKTNSWATERDENGKITKSNEDKAIDALKKKLSDISGATVKNLWNDAINKKLSTTKMIEIASYLALYESMGKNYLKKNEFSLPLPPKTFDYSFSDKWKGSVGISAELIFGPNGTTIGNKELKFKLLKEYKKTDWNFSGYLNIINNRKGQTRVDGGRFQFTRKFNWGIGSR